MLRVAKKLLEGIAALVGIVALLAALALWRLHVSPVSSNMLTPYLEAGIERLIPGARVTVGHSLLTWDNESRSLAFYADALNISGAGGEPILDIPHLDARIRLFGILLGQFFPTVLNVEHPQLRLAHLKDGRLALPGIVPSGDLRQDSPKSLPQADEARDAIEATQGLVRHLAGALVPARATKKLNVMRAVLDVRDEEGRPIWSVAIPEISLARRGGELGGQAVVELTQGDSLSKLTLHYRYDSQKSRHGVSTRFDSITPALLAGGHPENLGFGEASMLALPLTGSIALEFDDSLDLVALESQIHGDKGSLDIPAFWDGARTVSSLDAHISFDRSSGGFSVAPLRLDFGGPSLEVTAKSETPALKGTGEVAFEANVTLRDWPMDQYASLWPKPIIPNARAWIANNLSGGAFERGEARFRGVIPLNKPEDMTLSEGQGTILASRARVAYIEGMPPVEDVSARADFDLKTMTVAISGGGIGAIRIVPFTLTMRDLDQSLQIIDIPLKVSGPARDILRLIDHPPLGYAKAVDLAPDKFLGRAEGIVKLRFPMLKALSVKDIDVLVDAKLDDVLAMDLFKGVSLSRGALALSLTGKGLILKGSAELNGVPIQIEAEQFFDPKGTAPRRKASLSARLTREHLRKLGIPMMAESAEGIQDIASESGSAKGGGFTSVFVQISEPREGPSRARGTLDMTKASFVFEPLNWRKLPKAPALLTFEAAVPEDGTIDIPFLELRGQEAQVKGKATLSPTGEVLAMEFYPFRLGRSDAALNYSRGGNGAEERVEITGRAFDISGLKGGKEPGHSSPSAREYRLKLDTLLTSDVGFVSNAEGRATRDREGWTAISFHGMADGGSPLDIELTPQDDGSRRLRIVSDNFGRALKGLGFTDTVKDGSLEIKGASVAGNSRAIEGTIKIGSFVVKDLPFLMLLLNATSPFGLTGLLTDSASFDRLDGKFRWEGDTIELRHVHAAGTSTGMNIDGKIDLNTGEARLRGTIVPFGTVNRLIGSVPLLGDIITGGEDGGVLAVSYTLRGPLEDPEISVNPVSLLAPGFLRNLFFGGDDEEADNKQNSKIEPWKDEKNNNAPTPHNLTRGERKETR